MNKVILPLTIVGPKTMQTPTIEAIPPGEFPAPARKEAEHDEGQPGEPEAFHRGQRVGEGVRHPFPDGHGRDDADQQRADDPGAPAAGGCGSWRIHSGFPIWIHISSDQWNRLG